MRVRRAMAFLLLLAPALPGAQEPVVPLLDVSMRVLMVGNSGTETVDERSDVFLMGEGTSLVRTFTLSLGEGRSALVDIDLAWRTSDMMGETLLLHVDSRAVLTSALGWTSPEVGQIQERRQGIELQPNQDHLYQFFLSADMKLKMIAVFRYGSLPGYEPAADKGMEPVVFRIRSFDGEGRRRRLVEDRSYRSLAGNEVGFEFRDEEPVYVPKSPDDPDPSGLLQKPEKNEWTERHVSEPIRIQDPDKQKKEAEKMRKRMEKGKMTEKDVAILMENRDRKNRLRSRVEAVEVRFRPVFMGHNVLRAEMILKAEFLYPDLQQEARVDVERVVDFYRAEPLRLDLLDLAGEEPLGYPHHYHLEVQAIW